MALYLLITDFQPGVADTPMDEWKPEEVEGHLDYYRRLNAELTETGELVDVTILTGPDLAKVVTSDGSSSVVTDGPFQEFKEWVAGFQVVDVESEARALEIAARVSAVPGPGGVPIQQPITVRRVMDRGPSSAAEMGDFLETAGGRPLTETVDVDGLLRRLAPQVVGALTRRYGDFDAAEDAAQEALLAAASRWPIDGVPAKPDAWLIQAASRRFIDEKRSEVSRRAREAMAVRMAADSGAPPILELERDDSLLVLFMCCHPALTPASAIALTLRAVGGLTTAEIANAFLVPEATMAQRISRAKAQIRASEVPVAMPSPEEQAERLRLVRQVLYLIFNEGYTASAGDALQRTDLADEAIRLARLLHDLRPDDPELTGLLALMLLIDARRAARTTASGMPVPLAEQDRSRWDRARIAEGRDLLDEAMADGRVGEYQLQAAIAALHDTAPTADATDWPQIAALYGVLERVTGNPIVTLNRAVAVGMADGPRAGLALVDTVAERLAGNARLDAVRAYLLECAGDLDGALAAYRAAAARTTSLPEQWYLLTCAARLAAAVRASSD